LLLQPFLFFLFSFFVQPIFFWTSPLFSYRYFSARRMRPFLFFFFLGRTRTTLFPPFMSNRKQVVTYESRHFFVSPSRPPKSDCPLLFLILNPRVFLRFGPPLLLNVFLPGGVSFFTFFPDRPPFQINSLRPSFFTFFSLRVKDPFP